MTKAVLISNTVDLEENSLMNGSYKYEDVKKPMLLFIDGSEVIESFSLVAKTKRELEIMMELKFFYTESIPSGEEGNQFGATFHGTSFEELYEYEEEMKKEQSAATDYSTFC